MKPVINSSKINGRFVILLSIILLAFPAATSFAIPALTDISITDTVEDELNIDAAVPAGKIDVTTRDGVVTLSGSVTNILAKDRAARIAEMVKGVRAVVNNIKVVPIFLRSDWALENDIEDAVLMDPATESFEIDVKVDAGKVTISGTVDSLAERDICENVIKSVKGVTAVVNNLIVDIKSERMDSEIENDIQQKLKWDEYVDHYLITVKSENGHVRLTGIVGSAAEKRQARLNAYVAGTKSVDTSDLKVERWARDEDLRKDKYIKKSDGDILEAVRDALLHDPRVASFNVLPEVSDGKVILRGVVDNLKAKRAAAEDARHTVGVIFVENRLKVRSTVKIDDTKLEQRITNAFKRDPYIERYGIVVDAVNGIVRLYGSVDTYYEKFKAEDIASRIKGVSTVKNNLDVEEDYEPYVTSPYLDDVYPEDHEWYRYEPSYSLKSDAEIEADVRDELWWSPFVDLDDVTVSVENGIATLTGTVDSWSEYNASAKNAYEAGAALVRNELTVLESK